MPDPLSPKWRPAGRQRFLVRLESATEGRGLSCSQIGERPCEQDFERMARS
jgi:hypothetical protein